MAIFSTILVGLVVGAIAKLLMPGKDPGGFIVTILLGIAGAFIAAYLGQALGWYKAGQPAGWIMSIIGAMILLLLISDALPFGWLWYGEPNAISNAVDLKFYGRSYHAVIRVYDATGNVIETHEHAGEFKEW
jgi:uncharacterized membrane protein YeaQ/YmgE (transglycosylase-associated protein family)